ncbi:MAG: hypothetical protein PVJ67_05680 [Candidatus Pacearchaeota archaeon]|jgi:hypothetical protein
MVINYFKIIGVIGLLLISIGIITKKRKKQDAYYLAGGICLLIYSSYLRDIIFIIFQSVFTLSAIYDLHKQLK